MMAAAFVAVVMMAAPVVAEDPPEGRSEDDQKATASEQTQKEEEPVLKAQPTAKRGSSLADVAGRIKLNKPPADGGSGVVISDQNLQKVSSKGRISVAGVADPVASEEAAGAAGQTGAGAPGGADAQNNPANALLEQYLAQKRKVDELEALVAHYDKQLDEPNPDPHYVYSHQSPQNRAPGVQDPAITKRDDAAKQLEEERKQLDEARRKATEAGVRLEEPAKK
jgi:hypothetical protein